MDARRLCPHARTAAIPNARGTCPRAESRSAPRVLCSLTGCVARYPRQGVTYCGESSASSLTMANVPWHEEVVGFVQQLAAMLPDYELACEHEHSNCLLLAHKRAVPCGL
ncbi:unnamed protein product [Lampetra planeri]